MPRSAKAKRLQRKMARRLRQEAARLAELKKTAPEMFRLCGDKPCCQGRNADGRPCQRPAVTETTYIPRMRCCYLCWEHIAFYGLYATYRLAKVAGTAHLSWDEYCAYFPKECEEILEKGW